LTHKTELTIKNRNLLLSGKTAHMIELLQGDITNVYADAIVNATNTSLLGGGDVNRAIHRAGGKAIVEECFRIRREQGGCNVGRAVITTAGNLPAKFVIHTVGPYWNGGIHGEVRLLSSAYKSCLTLAVHNGVKTIAFPNISTGVYGFPKQEAAEIAFHSVSDFLIKENDLEKVIFVCLDAENYNIYYSLLKL